jgi:predicted permease
VLSVTGRRTIPVSSAASVTILGANLKELVSKTMMLTFIAGFVQDLRSGARILTQAPALSATAALLVAIVIGGNTTVFSIVHGILKKPAAGVRATGLVRLNWINEKTGTIEPSASYPNYMDLLEQNALEPMLVSDSWRRLTLHHENGSYAVNGSLVSDNYFDTLGVRLAQGRGFADDASGTSASDIPVVISHNAWQNYFYGADVIGRPIRINQHPATIAGVAQRGFRGMRLGESADVWIPLLRFGRASGEESVLQDRFDALFDVTGRLAHDASLAQATVEIGAVWARLQASHPELKDWRITLVPYSAVAGSGTGLDHSSNRLLGILAIITMITLVVACANVANLLLGRAVARQREMALRQALGASRARILRLLFAEGFIISSLAASAAFLFAWWTARGLSGIVPPGEFSALTAVDFTPDWRVAAYAATLAAVALVAFTIAPAVRTWQLALLPWLRSGEQAVVQGRSTLSRALVVVQVAFSVLLLTCAGLAYRSLFLMGVTDPGFDTANLVRVTINTEGSATTAEMNRAIVEMLRGRLREVPGVRQVSYARLRTFHRGWTGRGVRNSSTSSEPVNADINYVGAEFLSVLGVPVAGREFTERDNAYATGSAVISRNLAEALWPGQSPIGRTVLIDQGNERERRPAKEAQVVGVSADGFFSGFRREHLKFVFLSAAQEPSMPGATVFHVRYTGSLDTIAPAIVRKVRDVDGRAAIAEIRTLESDVDAALWPIRVIATLLTAFAAGSLLIAAIGQYAAMSFEMRRRTREVGLRIALGASSRQVLTSVIKQGGGLTAIGLAIGFALSIATGRLLGRSFYGVTPTDPLTYLGVFALLFVASLVACILPARRASIVDPVVALRYE